MLRIVATVCLFFSLALIVYPQSRGRTWLNGRWEGTGYQIDTDTTWSVRFMTRGKSYLIEYPSLNCGGEWKLIRINSGRAIFREKLNVGLQECVNNSTVVIERLNGRQLSVRYSYRGRNEVYASVILNRKR